MTEVGGWRTFGVDILKSFTADTVHLVLGAERFIVEITMVPVEQRHNHCDKHFAANGPVVISVLRSQVLAVRLRQLFDNTLPPLSATTHSLNLPE